MALRELNLIVDKDSRRLVESFTSTLPAAPQRFVIGDSVPVNVRVVTADPSSVWQEVDLTDQSIRLAIGAPAAQPTSGTWTVTYGGDTTSALDFDATAAELETALNALASITSAGGVSITKSTSGAYRVVFDSAGARTVFSTDNAGLYPSTDSFISEAVTGDGSTREIVLIKLETQPAAYVELTDPLPSASATVTTVRAGDTDVSEIQRFVFDPVPYGGSYTITIDGEKTGALAYDADATAIKAAIEALASIGAGKVTVTGAFPRWTVEFDASLTDVAEMTVDVTGLTVPVGRSGELSTNTTGIMELLDGAAQAAATLEIEIYDTSESTAFTVVQVPCTVLDDVIGSAPSSQTPLPTYLTADSIGANGIAHDPAITDLTGGGATKLDGIETASKTVGRLQAVTTGTSVYVYKLVSGTDAESSPTIVRPDDYAGTTNEKVWELLGVITSFLSVFTSTTDGNVVGSAANGVRANDLPDGNGTLALVADPTGQIKDSDVAGTVVAVASLPAAGTAGRRRFVNDANATTFASVVAGGGANVVPVYDDGTNWRIG